MTPGAMIVIPNTPAPDATTGLVLKRDKRYAEGCRWFVAYTEDTVPRLKSTGTPALAPALIFRNEFYRGLLKRGAVVAGPPGKARVNRVCRTCGSPVGRHVFRVWGECKECRGKEKP